MRIIGNIELIGQGHIANARLQVLEQDPASPLVGQLWYNSTDGVYRGFDGTTVIDMASAGDLTSLIEKLDTAIDGAGLSETGEYVAHEASNYLGDATSLHNADLLLDAAIRQVAQDLESLGEGDLGVMQNEIDAIETGAGLSETGEYVAHEGSNYLDEATSLHAADLLLDAAVASAAGAASDAQDAADLAQQTADAALPKAGGVMTGNIQMSGQKVIGLGAPVDSTDAVNKAYVDAAIAGLDFQADIEAIVRDADFEPELVAGRRYIIVDAGSVHASFGTIEGLGNNDIVQYDGEGFQVVYDVSERGEGAIAWNRADDTFSFYDGTTWSNFGGMTGVVAGLGLEKDGNTLSVKLGAGIGNLPTGEVGLDLQTGAGLFLTEDGSTESTSSDAKLAIRLDGGSLTVDADGLAVADAGITADHLAASVAGDGLTGGEGEALSIALAQDSGLLLTGGELSFDASLIANMLDKTGDTMTGDLTLAGDPTQALHAATKQYVDALHQELVDAQSGSVFVYNGSVSSATHVVEHNIGSQYCNVTVVDSNDRVILPDTITFDSANQLTVTFASAITCRVVVSGLYVAPAPQAPQAPEEPEGV